jgi:hypothetical protein
MPQKTFGQYFKENMNALGLPAPDSLFGTAATATGTIKTLSDLVIKFGTSVTLAELLRTSPSLAAGASELSTVGSAALATFYLGACIGSLAVATGQATSGGYSISDLFASARGIGIYHAPWMHDVFSEVTHAKASGRRMIVRSA